MKRRDFIALAGCTAATGPLLVAAQPARKLPTIGFLGSATPQAWSPWLAAFLQRLGQLGWTEGRTVAIEYRWASGRPEAYAEMAAEFVRLKVDVIVTGGPPALSARRATSTIPIVLAIMGDPIGSGLVESLARPGGNVTGLSYQSTDLASKRVGILREALPQMKRLAVLGNVGNPQVVLEMREVSGAAQTLGLASVPIEMRRADDIASGFVGLGNNADALYVCVDPLSNANREQINALALGARLPTMYGVRDYVDDGGLMSYGPNFPDLFRRAADFVDRILRGAKPGDIPVEQPTNFDFVINLATAKKLGLTIPSTLLSLAEVIE